MRDEIQIEAIKEWKKSKIGTIVLPTGLGKTKCGVIIAGSQLEKNLIKSCLVVVPNIPLIEQWKKEFHKWGYSTKGITFRCIQSLYKMDNKYDLVIVDEIHTTLSPIYRRFYSTTKYSQILGLTATKPHQKEYLQILNSISPIVFEKKIEDALEAKAIADYVTFNVAVKFNRSEGAKYRLFNARFIENQRKIAILMYKNIPVDDVNSKKKQNIFEVAKEFSRSKEKTDLVKACKGYWAAMTLRKHVCWNALSKVNTILYILEKFKDRKWIIFTKTIKYATYLSKTIRDSRLYHSKLSVEERQKVLSDFANNKSKILIAVDALNAGLDVPDADAAICAAGVSTELPAIQQLGRIVRLKNYKALFFNLYMQNTVEENWVKNKTSNLKNTIWVNDVQTIKYQ